MQPNPFASLLKSRKFWLLILDAILSLSVYFLGKYVPVAAEDLNVLILTLQPVFITIIGSVAYEDAAAMRAKSAVDVSKVDAEAARYSADVYAIGEGVTVKQLDAHK